MPGCLRECADGADLEGHLRGPHQGKLWQGAGRLCLGQSAETRSADRSPAFGAGGRSDHAEGSDMRRIRAIVAESERDAMKNLRYIVLHAVAAAAFIFLLQRYGLSASLESSLLWALTFGGCAAGLAYSQVNR